MRAHFHGGSFFNVMLLLLAAVAILSEYLPVYSGLLLVIAGFLAGASFLFSVIGRKSTPVVIQGDKAKHSDLNFSDNGKESSGSEEINGAVSTDLERAVEKALEISNHQHAYSSVIDQIYRQYSLSDRRLREVAHGDFEVTLNIINVYLTNTAAGSWREDVAKPYYIIDSDMTERLYKDHQIQGTASMHN